LGTERAGTFGNFPGYTPCGPLKEEFNKEEFNMNKVIISLALGAGALFATAASAAPLSNGLAVIPDNGIENVRMVCNEYGRCWRERSGRRVIVEDSYGYAPRERYIERRGYDGYDRGPSVGIGVGPGGVGVGVGVGPRW
jgi:hypothetical protein